jgi:hypothetical protein
MQLSLQATTVAQQSSFSKKPLCGRGALFLVFKQHRPHEAAWQTSPAIDKRALQFFIAEASVTLILLPYIGSLTLLNPLQHVQLLVVVVGLCPSKCLQEPNRLGF